MVFISYTLYTYYNIPNQKNFIGLELAAWTNNNLEIFKLSENGENYTYKYPISFSSLFHEHNDWKKHMITGIKYDNNIKNIKFLYNDGKSFEEPITGNGYIIIRNDYRRFKTNLKSSSSILRL